MISAGSACAQLAIVVGEPTLVFSVSFHVCVVGARARQTILYNTILQLEESKWNVKKNKYQHSAIDI